MEGRPQKASCVKVKTVETVSNQRVLSAGSDTTNLNPSKFFWFQCEEQMRGQGAGDLTGAGRPASRVCRQCGRDQVFWCPTQGGPVGRTGQTQTHSGEELVGDDCPDGTEAGATDG